MRCLSRDREPLWRHQRDPGGGSALRGDPDPAPAGGEGSTYRPALRRHGWRPFKGNGLLRKRYNSGAPRDMLRGHALARQLHDLWAPGELHFDVRAAPNAVGAAGTPPTSSTPLCGTELTPRGGCVDSSLPRRDFRRAVRRGPQGLPRSHGLPRYRRQGLGPPDGPAVDSHTSASARRWPRRRYGRCPQVAALAIHHTPAGDPSDRLFDGRRADVPDLMTMLSEPEFLPLHRRVLVTGRSGLPGSVDYQPTRSDLPASIPVRRPFGTGRTQRRHIVIQVLIVHQSC